MAILSSLNFLYNLHFNYFDFISLYLICYNLSIITLDKKSYINVKTNQYRYPDFVLIVMDYAVYFYYFDLL